MNFVDAKTRSLRILHVLVGSLLCLAACTTPHAKYAAIGGTPNWKRSLPKPTGTIAEPDTLTLNFFGPTFGDPEFLARLKQEVRSQVADSPLGSLRPVSDVANNPHYEVTVCEAGDDGSFRGNLTAGVGSAVGSGLTAAIVTKRANMAAGGGLLAGVLGFVGLGERTDVTVFRIDCYQHTSTAGSEHLQEQQDVIAVSGSEMRAGVAAESMATADLDKVTSSAFWEVESHRVHWVKFIVIQAKGGAFTTRDERLAVARDVLQKNLASYVLGGNRVF